MLNRKMILKEADYILDKKETLRNLSKIFQRSKSSIHKDLTVNLYKVNQEKYWSVQKLFQQHKENRHIKGGEATKRKYLQ